MLLVSFVNQKPSLHCEQNHQILKLELPLFVLNVQKRTVQSRSTICILSNKNLEIAYHRNQQGMWIFSRNGCQVRTHDHQYKLLQLSF